MTTAVSSAYQTELIRRTGDNPATRQQLIAQLEMGDVDTDTGLLLDRKLAAALVLVETYTGLSLTKCERTVIWESLVGVGRLPYGPVWTTPAAVVTQLGGTVLLISSYSLSESRFPMLTGQYSTGVSVAYTAGYTAQADEDHPELDKYVIPDALSDAILVCAAELYCQTTGFQSPKKLMNNWRSLAAPFRRFE
ncbi:hypothetical protein [Larkinella terrae]|uniref:Uncharacterized protein n=1 Tax=Larkinella terrae TaxID=2025311 RepID=A0A7K0EIU4_9BACT|nr:hypothetical protein [Larkinella terrae]MRS61780.1 hypothetical protein [Larkinella terrae]